MHSKGTKKISFFFVIAINLQLKFLVLPLNNPVFCVWCEKGCCKGNHNFHVSASMHDLLLAKDVALSRAIKRVL